MLFTGTASKINNLINKWKGIISEKDIENMYDELLKVMIDGDIALEVAEIIAKNVKDKAIGQKIFKNVNAQQMIIKILQDEIVDILGKNEINLTKNKKTRIMFVGLQGAGKTTSVVKLAKKISNNGEKTIAVCSLDCYRPAAKEQLSILSNNNNIKCFEYDSEDPIKIAKEAVNNLSEEISIFDTAGRLHIDNSMMDELLAIKKIVQPTDTILVLDGMYGQDSYNVVREFNDKIKITGAIITRLDADPKGGVAISLKYLTKCPILYICNGEKINDILPFDSAKMANMIIGMGDIVSLVEKASVVADETKAIKFMDKMMSGKIDFDDWREQLAAVLSMGGMKDIIKFMPIGINNMATNSKVDDKHIKKQIAIISSMTKKEKKNYKIINGSRKQRIATGSGTTVQEVNQLIKQFEGMMAVMKQFSNQRGGSIFSKMKGMINSNNHIKK